MVKPGKASKKSLNISKGIIFTFFVIYFIVFGGIISEFSINFQKSNPVSFPVFITYIPLLCYLGAIFCGIGFIIFIRNATSRKARETQSRKKIKSGSLYKQALFLLICIFAFIPLLSPIIDEGENTQHFSIYNPGWNGCSELRQMLIDENFEVQAVQSSLSATERLEKNFLLVLMGPNQFYDPIFEVPYFIDFFNGSNSLLICHDHGSTSTLLWEILIASVFDPDIQIPLTIFPDGILRDNLTYNPTPEFPIIQQFAAHPTTAGINNVLLSRSSCAVGGPFISQFGWTPIGSSSDKYSFIDKNEDGRYESGVDDLNLGFMSLIDLGFPLPDTFPLGGYAQHVFLANDMGRQRIFVSADASLFNNELIDLDDNSDNVPDYDNLQFAKNIIEWLTYVNEGSRKDEWIIVFDEAHIRPETSRDLTSAGIFGFIMQYIVHLSTNPITAWIYPLLALYTLRRYLPKKDKKEEERKIAEEEEKKEEKARFRTSSFFAQKIEEFKDKSKYGEALKLLYRRLERKLHSQMKGQKITTQNVVDFVIAKDPSTTKLKVKRLSRFMDKIISIKEGKDKVRTEEDFEGLFFEMEWVVNNI
ncbi:MAG: hypothetical protein ACXAEX_06400 [Promethearchaeota archaeon]|jgi:hypothetical protein